MKTLSGKEFRPGPELRNLYFLQMFLILAVCVFPWLLPVAIFVEWSISSLIVLGTVLFILPFLVIAMIWVPLYCKTITYKLADSEMTWKRGVWFKNTGVVPYNRVTNVDVKQGPLSRMLGIGSLHIQTAGYSGPNSRGSEITIDGMKNFEELQDSIMGLVRGKKPVAAETFEEGDPNAAILGELRKIRKLLEKRK
jgi:membrane protein YdbS with pleckstrin-like domain